MNNSRNLEGELLTFILSRIGLTENELLWLKNGGISFGKEPIFIRKYLMENLKIPNTFLKELLTLGMEKKEILEILNLNLHDIENLAELYGVQLLPRFIQMYDPEKGYHSVVDPTDTRDNQLWRGLVSAYTIPYNSLSYYDIHKELRAKIMVKLREKNIDFEEISDLFNYSLRMTREVIKNVNTELNLDDTSDVEIK